MRILLAPPEPPRPKRPFQAQAAVGSQATRLLLVALLSLLPVARAQPPSPFLAEPYLQLGSAPAADALTLVWHGPDRDQAWAVRVAAGRRSFTVRPAWERVAVATVEPHRVYSALLRPLPPGALFRYRVILDGRPVFRARARARKTAAQSQRVAVLGDLVDGHAPPRAMAAQVFRHRPDLVVVPGDIVYQDGRIPEYRRNFFPVYNAGRGDAATGAPLLRSTLFVAALGNHDVGERGPRHPHADTPDGMAYYLYWRQPLNGPALRPEGPNAPPLMDGPDWTWQPFLAAAGPRFPAMGTFSFDAGNVHWTVLDSNPYMRWDSRELQDWLARDLEQARGAAWRFVVFHHPAFNLAEGNIYVDQWMGRIWPLLERGGVDLAFTGHIHTYVRTLPMRFSPDPESLAALDPRTQRGALQGSLDWDPDFDGRTRTRARGVIHIITGAGGVHLHLKGKAALFRLRPYVARAVSEEHSFSLLDIKGRRLTFRQIGARGQVLDRFTLTR